MVDKYYDLMQEQSIYSVSGALVKQAGKFNSTNSTVELNVTSKTEIEKLPDDPKIKSKNFNFVKIQQIEEIEQNKIIDVMGFVKEVKEVEQITTKAGQKSK